MSAIVQTADAVTSSVRAAELFTVMTKEVAERTDRAAMDALKSSVRFGVIFRRKLQELHAAKAHTLLGYPSWESYVKQRFGIALGTSYRLLNASITDWDIVAVNSHEDVPEFVLRPLAGLPPEVKQAAWVEAEKIAEGNLPSQADVKAAVAKVSPRGEAKESPTRESGSTEEQGCLANEAKDVQRARKRGIIPANATVTDDGANEPEVEEEEAPAEMTDEEYLAECQAREHLSPQVRKMFDAEALMFREMTPFRLEFVKRTESIRKKWKKIAGHLGPFNSKLTRFLTMKDPRDWVYCLECNGTGEQCQDIKGLPESGHECKHCKGEGYHVR